MLNLTRPHFLARGLLLFALAVTGAHADEPPIPDSNPPANADPHRLDPITVEAQRNRHELERRVDSYVSSAIVRHHDWSYSRWNTPICPLVAGLSRDQGEFVLARVSQVARTAGAPLAGEKCDPNFLIVATHDPKALLNAWRHRDAKLFNATFGEAPIDKFINGARPIRAWYNMDFANADGAALFSGTIPGLSANNQAPTNKIYRATRLQFTSIRQISTAIVILDTTALKDINFGQLADYIALIGMAEVNADADLGDAPTILDLFVAPDKAPRDGLSAWDKAVLKSLYATRQADTTQLTDIEVSTLHEIAP